MNTPNFSYEEVDSEGLNTLNILSDTHRFNNWIYQTVKPFVTGSILEIGSGNGNITQCFLDDKIPVTASDIRKNYCTILRNRFKTNKCLIDIKNIDIMHSDFENKYADILESFDTVFAINIVEHLENDFLAIQNCRKLLRSNGILIILVPACDLLYNRFDVELKHFRRYSKKKLSQLLTINQFKIVEAKYFNLAGVLGWWFSGNILHKKIIPAGQMKIFNTLVPLFKIIDMIFFNQFGLSVVVAATKR